LWGSLVPRDDKMGELLAEVLSGVSCGVPSFLGMTRWASYLRKFFVYFSLIDIPQYCHPEERGISHSSSTIFVRMKI
jgi:hypothetical protein